MYECPVCGKVVSKTEMIEKYPCGCDCEFVVEDEDGEPVYLRIYHEWVKI